MWISKARYERIIDRIGALEDRTELAWWNSWHKLYPGRHHWPGNKMVAINVIVAMMANKMGLTYMPEHEAHFEFKEPEKEKPSASD